MGSCSSDIYVSPCRLARYFGDAFSNSLEGALPPWHSGPVDFWLLLRVWFLPGCGVQGRIGFGFLPVPGLSFTAGGSWSVPPPLLPCVSLLLGLGPGEIFN